MKNNNFDSFNALMWFALVYFLFMWSATTLNAQKLYDGELYDVIYSEDYEQPLQETYRIMCPTVAISRSGMDFWNPK